ncbi:MAG TPA: Trp family transcriptional regulator [Candidatus Peribacteraceae bacterium]|nr:Trp family transcriptional regulator [Candidatus Peribacteraceae bacterium]
MPSNRSDAELIKLLAKHRSAKQWQALLQDLFTPQERASLGERLQIVKLLAKGVPQRGIAKKLGVSISKVTRGSRVLQYGKGGLKSGL